MNRFESVTKPVIWFMALLLAALTAGCGGGQGPILGSGGGATLAPTVTAVAPVNNAVGVPINSTIITANFSEPMSPITGAATFTVTCVAPCVNPTGPVTLDVTNRIATFGSTTALTPLTLYTATITGATSLATGLALASPYVWHFTTGLTPDTTKPRVLSTIPVTTTPGLLPVPGVATAGVATNTAIAVTFTEDMAPASITAASFTLTGPPGVTPVLGVAIPVTYNVGSRTATFTPAAALAPLTTYTATVKGTGASVATDLAGNILAGDPALPLVANDYVWTFTTAAAPLPPVPVTAVINSPLAGAINVCPNATVSATFSVAMDTLPTTAAFTMADAALAPVPGSTALDPTLTIATFTPLNPLVNGTSYTVTIKGGALGVKDLAIPANTMTLDKVWTFTAGPATGICLPPVNLGTASTFGIAAHAGVTNTPTVPLTHIEGDVILDPVASAICNAVAIDAAGGFGLCAGSPPTINGTVISALYDPANSRATVLADLNAAFLSITPPAGPPAAGSLGGATAIAAPTNLGGAVGLPYTPGVNYFTPGVYQSITSIMVTGDLTLDALGNPNAVFVFQSSSTVGTAAGAAPPGVRTRILLVGGAKASNVWWQAGSDATLGLYSEFQGNILAARDITMLTGATSCGRLMAGAWVGVGAGSGAFVFDSNVVSVPGQPFAPPATYSAVCQ